MDDLFIDVKDDVKEDLPQADDRVYIKKRKRNVGLKDDIMKIVESNPCLNCSQVFDLVKNNVYGGSSPLTIATVSVTMSYIKKQKVKDVNVV